MLRCSDYPLLVWHSITPPRCVSAGQAPADAVALLQSCAAPISIQPSLESSKRFNLKQILLHNQPFLTRYEPSSCVLRHFQCTASFATANHPPPPNSILGILYSDTSQPHILRQHLHESHLSLASGTFCPSVALLLKLNIFVSATSISASLLLSLTLYGSELVSPLSVHF